MVNQEDVAINSYHGFSQMSKHRLCFTAQTSPPTNPPVGARQQRLPLENPVGRGDGHAAAFPASPVPGGSKLCQLLLQAHLWVQSREQAGGIWDTSYGRAAWLDHRALKYKQRKRGIY